MLPIILQGLLARLVFQVLLAILDHMVPLDHVDLLDL